MDADQKREQEIDAAWTQYTRPPRFKSYIHRGWLKRHLTLQRDLCAYCGISMLPMTISLNGEEHRHATVDHIIPTSKGGVDEIENTLAACQRCNSFKSNLSVEEFAKSLELYERLKFVANGPDRLSTDKDSPYYDETCIERGIEVHLDGTICSNFVEYCVSDQWIRLKMPEARDRNSHTKTIRVYGNVVALYEDNLRRIETIDKGIFVEAFNNWLESRHFDTGESKDH